MAFKRMYVLGRSLICSSGDSFIGTAHNTMVNWFKRQVKVMSRQQAIIDLVNRDA